MNTTIVLLVVPGRVAGDARAREPLEHALQRRASEAFGIVVAGHHALVDGIDRAAADRVVRLVAEQRAPGLLDRGPFVGHDRAPRAERRPRLEPIR